MEKIAFFDFCETLVDFQTADAFVHFVRMKHGDKRMLHLNRMISFLNRAYILPVIEKLVPNTSLNKRLVLRQLKGISKEAIEQFALEYYKEMIKPHQIPQMMDVLHNCQLSGYRVVLVSGGYDKYLHFFAADNGIAEDDIISTRIEFKKGFCTGRFSGVDCMGKNKVMLLDKRFNQKGIQSISYSDSSSDTPFLSWTKDQFVVSRDREQEWAKNHNYKQIIWHH